MKKCNGQIKFTQTVYNNFRLIFVYATAIALATFTSMAAAKKTGTAPPPDAGAGCIKAYCKCKKAQATTYPIENSKLHGWKNCKAACEKVGGEIPGSFCQKW